MVWCGVVWCGVVWCGRFKDEVFPSIRRRYPHYKIAIFYVHCSWETVQQRANSRGKITGRTIDAEKLRMPFEKCPKSIEILTPFSDYVVYACPIRLVFSRHSGR